MGKEGKGKDEFYLDVKDPEIATLDKKTGMLTGLVEGETTVSFFKLFDYELVFDINISIFGIFHDDFFARLAVYQGQGW